KEQSAAQKVFPHYFERYVTDGVEFNIYIGQSIAPRRKFDEIYLRNMKIWQLTVLARAAKLTHDMESEMALPLKTTQLILAHSIPLSISFRTAERKFDVDGAYNIRYEIVKKRIDKVRIKDTNERLTQPGKIAIVYSQAKEAGEYLEYIEFLQNQKLLNPGVEKYDLEELQGVSGLKALRVDVNFNEVGKMQSRIELSNTTTEKLLGK
ncbi:MAG: GAF domain-containing protein, partial [Bacteroidota bacterium]